MGNIKKTDSLDLLSGRLLGANKFGFFPSKFWHYGQLNSSEDAPRKVTFLGDSVMKSLAGTLKDVTKIARFSNGLGYVPLSISTNSEQYTIVITNCTYDDTPENDDEFGISGEVLKMTSTGTVSYTHTDQSGDDNDFHFNGIKIYYLKRDGGGAFHYRIDGGSWVDVDTQNATSEIGIEEVTGISLVTMKNHLIEIESVSGENWIYGLKTYITNQGGLNIDFISQGGLSANEWSQASHYLDYFEDTKPDQVNILFGYNDVSEGRTKEQFIADIDTIVTAIKAVCNSYVDIVLWGHYDQGTVGDISVATDNTLLRSFDDELLSYALENDCSFFDMYNIMPDRSVGNDMGLWLDSTHLNATGQNFLCKKINEFTTYQSSYNLMSKQAVNYVDFDSRVHWNKSFGFFNRSSGGVVTDTGMPKIYTLSTSRLYIDVNSKTYLMREYFSIPVPIKPPTVADADAGVNTMFIGSDHTNKLCFKDAGGTVHELY